MNDERPTWSRRRFLRGLLIAAAAATLPRPATAASRRGGRAGTDLGFIASRMGLSRRAEWTGTGPRPGRLNWAGRYFRITVHHAGTSANFSTSRRAVAADLNHILSAHTRLKYGDIAYHFIIDYGGRVWEGRSLVYEGAHVSSGNEGNVGVMLLGNFEKQRPSAAQIHSMNELVALLEARFGISPRRVFGHRDLGQTLCPGQHLYPHVANLRRSRGVPTYPV